MGKFFGVRDQDEDRGHPLGTTLVRAVVTLGRNRGELALHRHPTSGMVEGVCA